MVTISFVFCLRFLLKYPRWLALAVSIHSAVRLPALAHRPRLVSYCSKSPILHVYEFMMECYTIAGPL